MKSPIKTIWASLACTVMEVISQEIVKEEVISALYILGPTWYLRWGMTCIELTVCVCVDCHKLPSSKCNSLECKAQGHMRQQLRDVSMPLDLVEKQ